MLHGGKAVVSGSIPRSYALNSGTSTGAFNRTSNVKPV
jgi:hypothetical protein